MRSAHVVQLWPESGRRGQRRMGLCSWSGQGLASESHKKFGHAQQRAVHAPGQWQTHSGPGQCQQPGADVVGRHWVRAPARQRPCAHGPVASRSPVRRSVMNHLGASGRTSRLQTRPDHQHAGQDAAWSGYRPAVTRQAQAQLVLAHVVHHHRARARRRWPRRSAAGRGWHPPSGCQTSPPGRPAPWQGAAVHAHDHAQGRHKQHDAAGRRTAGHAQVKGAPQHEKTPT